MSLKQSTPTAHSVSLLHDDRGLTTVEYVILLVVIAIMSVAGWHKFGSGINTRLTDSQNRFDDEVKPEPK
jgi:Flp pilus assembly pilin Flp